MSFKGQAYLLHFAVPNFFFHVTHRLRHPAPHGVELGKRDYIGQILSGTLVRKRIAGR